MDTPPEADRIATLLRRIPAVEALLNRGPLQDLARRLGRQQVVNATRAVLEGLRQKVKEDSRTAITLESIEKKILAVAEAAAEPSLRPVINATGVILHTNLGRAPLAGEALAHLNEIATEYSNLEYDLELGERGKRDTHTARLFSQLLGAEMTLVVNNNAAAVFLALNTLAEGSEVIVSRGELIEIGGSFRIPEVCAKSGAVLREVGTTNRTRVADYAAAINERTRVLLRVHPSNFRIVGFTERPGLEELAALGKERNVVVYEDLGSGCLADLREWGIEEPLVGDSLKAGVDLVSFSGDKLLGGPQAGILAGKPDLVTRLRRNPLFRALRADKLIYQALEHTLRNLLLENWDEIPALAMIRQPVEEVRKRALALVARVPGMTDEVVSGQSVAGGGATPEQPIPTWLIAIKCADVVEFEKQLRAADPPVVARIEGERLMLDLRTVLREEENDLAAVLSRRYARS